MSTIRDIARELRVSPSTVSRVLNGSASISEETSRRVLMAAEKLHYSKRPYTTAKTRVQNTVGIVFPEMLSEYYTRITHFLNEDFKKHGFSSICAVTNFDSEEAVHAVERMAKLRVTCMVLVQIDWMITPKLIDAIRLSMIPVLLITTKSFPELDFDCVFIDEESANYLIAEHLRHRGYRKIGYIGEYYSQQRLELLKKALYKYGVTLNPSFIRVGRERGESGGRLRMQELLCMSELPDAIYASYDLMAIGAIQVIEDAGLRVPKDIAVISSDDIPLAKYVAGGLTTIGAPFEDISSIAVRIVLHRVLHPNNQTQQVAVKPVLKIRATT